MIFRPVLDNQAFSVTAKAAHIATGSPGSYTGETDVRLNSRFTLLQCSDEQSILSPRSELPGAKLGCHHAKLHRPSRGSLAVIALGLDAPHNDLIVRHVRRLSPPSRPPNGMST